MNENFSKINENYFGNGNPEGGLWFISGFEEAVPLKTKKDIDKVFRDEENWISGFFPFKEGGVPEMKEEFDNNPNNKKGGFTPIYAWFSKFIGGPNIGNKSQEMDWKTYRDRYLFTRDEKACQVNLYPLGKPDQKSEWPPEYEVLFDISDSKEDQDKYEKLVLKKRFPKILELWEKYAKVTVCLGKGKERWKEFRDLFNIRDISPEETKFFTKRKREVRKYFLKPDKIIILCWFVRYMNDEETLYIAETIKSTK